MNLLEGTRADPTCSQTSVRDIAGDIWEEKGDTEDTQYSKFLLK